MAVAKPTRHALHYVPGVSPSRTPAAMAGYSVSIYRVDTAESP